jgi:hypothetical protein
MAKADPEAPKFKAPKSLALAADKLYQVREARLKMQKDVDLLQAEETFLKEHLINTLPKSDAGGVQGKICRVSISMKEGKRVTDWHAYYANLVAMYNKSVKKKDGQEDGAFAFLQKRVGEKIIGEMWDAGQTVPGVEKYRYPDVSINKV